MGVNAMGFSVEEISPSILGSRRRMDFVNKKGELLRNLPVDEHHLRIWKRQGLTPATEENRPKPVNELVCSICGKGPFKAKIGLMGHLRTHT